MLLLIDLIWNLTTVSMVQCWSAVSPLDVAKKKNHYPDKATETNPLKVLRSVCEPSLLLYFLFEYKM